MLHPSQTHPRCSICSMFPSDSGITCSTEVEPSEGDLQNMHLIVEWTERLDEGRGSATIATAENDRLPRPSPMPREPRYLQRLVRPALVVRCLGGHVFFLIPRSIIRAISLSAPSRRHNDASSRGSKAPSFSPGKNQLNSTTALASACPAE